MPFAVYESKPQVHSRGSHRSRLSMFAERGVFFGNCVPANVAFDCDDSGHVRHCFEILGLRITTYASGCNALHTKRARFNKLKDNQWLTSQSHG